MARKAAYQRAGWVRKNKRVQPADTTPINTAADAEEALSVEEAKDKLAAAKQEAAEAEAKAKADKITRDAALAKAQRDVEAAALKAKQAEHRAKAAQLPALVAGQTRIEKARETQVAAQREAVRKEYAAKIEGWCRIILQRQGALNDVYGKNRERWAGYAHYSFDSTPRHWPVALRMDLVKASKVARGLLDHCEGMSKQYVAALDLARRCSLAGPPRNSMEQQRELGMFIAVGEAGNGVNRYRNGVNPRPAMEWIQDPHVKQQDWALTEMLAKIFAEGATYPVDGEVAMDGYTPVDEALANEREATKRDLRAKDAFEKSRSESSKQTHGDTSGPAFGPSFGRS